MPTWKLEIEYDGTRYRGWPMQHNAKTIQGELTGVTRELFSSPAEIFSGEATEPGIHSLRQIVHLKVPEITVDLTPAQLLKDFNELLPQDINIIKIANAPDTFHARKDAVGRYYLYQISTRRTAFAKNYVWWVKNKHDAKAMNEAAKLLVGRYDFRSFCELEEGKNPPTVINVERAEVFTDGDLICFRIGASHFFPKMVRRIVGLLAEVGRSDMSYDSFARLLKFPSDVPAKFTAPPSGLFLEKVLYKNDTGPQSPRSFSLIA
ncbi:MAG: tRNA pseudouridine(38-40) synthase TruA [Pyrinomonadaceae bacterium]